MITTHQYRLKNVFNRTTAFLITTVILVCTLFTSGCSKIDVSNSTSEFSQYTQDSSVDTISSNANSQNIDYSSTTSVVSESKLTFRNNKLLNQHYQKHGIEMGYSSAEEYEAAAAAVVNNSASLHKLEAEDGDDVYYLQSTNEFVIVSTDGYIRTYFYSDVDYYNRQ